MVDRSQKQLVTEKNRIWRRNQFRKIRCFDDANNTDFVSSKSNYSILNSKIHARKFSALALAQNDAQNRIQPELVCKYRRPTKSPDCSGLFLPPKPVWTRNGIPFAPWRPLMNHCQPRRLNQDEIPATIQYRQITDRDRWHRWPYWFDNRRAAA